MQQPPPFARKISATRQAMLMAHIDHPQPVDVHVHNATRRSLIDDGLLAPHREPGSSKNFPTTTKLTEEGRAVLAYILAEYAETLIATGFLQAPADDDKGILTRFEHLLSLKGERPDEPILKIAEPA